MEAYLDNSATTRCSDRAFALMQKVLLEDYGNPSSLHMKGVEAERYVKAAREKIAKTLKVTEKEIIFTSGGTESNNLAILGTAFANRRTGNRIITTAVEHASVANPRCAPARYSHLRLPGKSSHAILPHLFPRLPRTLCQLPSKRSAFC